MRATSVFNGLRLNGLLRFRWRFPNLARWFCLVSVCLLSFLAPGASVPTEYHTVWAQGFGGTNDDQITALNLDPQDRLHFAGYFTGPATLGLQTFTNSQLFDAFLAVVDASGEVLWVKSAGGSGQDAALGVGTDPVGNSFLCGYFQDMAQFDSVSLTNVGSNDAFVAKYSPEGEFMWVNALAGTGDDRAYAAAGDAQGNCYVTGHFQNTLTIAETNLVSRGGVDVFLAKFSSEGKLLWARSAGGLGVDVSYSVAVDPQGNALICGYHGDAAVFEGTTVGSIGNVDLFVAKYSPNGALIWVRSGGGTEQDYANALALDVDGNSYIAGTFRGNVQWGTQTFNGVGLRTYTAKYDAGGGLQWVKESAGSDMHGISVRDGHVLVTGQFLGAVNWGTNTVTSAGAFDGFVVQYSGNGDVEWARGFGGLLSDIGYGVALDSRLGVYVGGRMGGDVTFDAQSIVAEGGNDGFIARLSLAPFLLSQPIGITVAPGSDASFSVRAAGATPLAYQWFFNDVFPLNQQTNEQLVLAAVETQASGLYSVVVSNDYGSATSAPAFLNVFGLPRPRVSVNGLSQPTLDLTNQASATVEIQVDLPGAEIHYTLDGSSPTLASPRYNGPFLVARTSTIRSIVFDQQLASSQGEAALVRFFLGPPRFAVDGVVASGFTFSNVNSVSLELLPPIPGARMNYTVDETLPSLTNGLLYSVPIVLTQTTVIRASAAVDGMTNGVSDSVTVKIFRTFPLTIDPSLDGLVVLRPPGGVYPAGTVVQLSAQPFRGWTFLHWSGDASGTNFQTLITVDASRSVGAVFGTPLSTTNIGFGSIQVNPAAPFYPRGTVLRASAIPSPGSFFALWGGATSGISNPTIFTVSGPVPVVSALFSPLGTNTYSLAAVPVGSGSVEVTPRLNFYPQGAEVTLKATPDTGAQFRSWQGDVVAFENPLKVIMDRNRVIYSRFSSGDEPILHLPQWLTNRFEAQFIGQTGKVYTVQGSTDLIQWTTLFTVTNTTEQAPVIDPSPQLPFRFYRAVSP